MGQLCVDAGKLVSQHVGSRKEGFRCAGEEFRVICCSEGSQGRRDAILYSCAEKLAFLLHHFGPCGVAYGGTQGRRRVGTHMGAVETMDEFVHDTAHGGDGFSAISADFGPIHVHPAPPELPIGQFSAMVGAMRVKDYAQAEIKVILLPVQKQEARVGCNLEVRLRRWLEASCAAKLNIPKE